MQPYNDPELAIRSEFETLAARGRIDDYQLFVARHPDHPLADEARSRIEIIRGAARDANGELPNFPSGRPGTGGIMLPPPDVEKAVRSEFEMLAARGTVEAYELFIARHSQHPLASEARRRIKALANDR